MTASWISRRVFSRAPRPGGVRAYYQTVAPFMDLELGNRGDALFWRWVARQSGARSILDIGCGTGRVTDALCQSGVRVVGIDLSRDMLVRARSRLDRWPLARLVQTDMRGAGLVGSFDLVVAADDPFSHLTEVGQREAALATIRRLTRLNGLLVLDCLWFSDGELRLRCRPDGWRAERTIASPGGSLCVREHWTCDPATHVCQASYTYELASGRIEEATFQARYWTQRELETVLPELGFRIEDRWGGYGRSAWRPNSKQLIVRARRVRTAADSVSA